MEMARKFFSLLPPHPLGLSGSSPLRELPPTPHLLLPHRPFSHLLWPRRRRMYRSDLDSQAFLSREDLGFSPPPPTKAHARSPPPDLPAGTKITSKNAVFPWVQFLFRFSFLFYKGLSRPPDFPVMVVLAFFPPFAPNGDQICFFLELTIQPPYSS